MNATKSDLSPVPVTLRAGCCHALFAYDVGYAIGLDHATDLVAAAAERRPIRHVRKAPAYFEYRPVPLRVSQPCPTLDFGRFRCEPRCECTVFDFGAVSVAYRIPLEGPLADLPGLSALLYGHPGLLQDSRRQVDALLAAIGESINRERVDAAVEDYLIFELSDLDPAPAPEAITPESPLGRIIAGVLRSESGAMSVQEATDALSAHIGYGPADAAFIDWNAAVLIDEGGEDARTVLEFANVETLEMRFLDDRLDAALEETFALMGRDPAARLPFIGRGPKVMERVARLQIDNAALFEAVNNALKLIGDQYLARLYRLAAQRFHLAERDATVLRKLGTLESIYQKLSDERASRRAEALEWVIILLIALEIVLALLRIV